MKAQLHAFITSVFDGSEQSASRPDRFAPGERVLRTHCPWSQLNAEKWRIKSLLPPRIESRFVGRTARYMVTKRNELSPLRKKGIRGWWNVFKRFNVENMIRKIWGKHLNSFSCFTKCLLFYFCKQMAYVFMFPSSLIRKIKWEHTGILSRIKLACDWVHWPALMSVVTNFLLLLPVNFTVVPYYIWDSTDSRPQQTELKTQALHLMLLTSKRSLTDKTWCTRTWRIMQYVTDFATT